MKFLSLILALGLTLAATPASAGGNAVSKYTEESPSMKLEVTWQRFGLPLPDRESDAVVSHAVASFRAIAEEQQTDFRELQAKDPTFTPHVCEMVLEGTLAGNGRMTGILWKSYQYLGGAHGNLILSARTYTNPGGKHVTLQDLFRDPEKALQLMSELSRKKLLQRDLPPDMVKEGTEPDIGNFQTFLPEKDGLTLYFSPYQVAPWSEGVVTVTLTLEELAAAGPCASYWK